MTAAAHIVMTTYPNDGRQLKRLILAVLKQDLAACVQRINYVKSYFVREGKITKQEEKLLLFKTTTEKADKLQEFIRANHPYTTPEIMTLHADQVNESYLAWLGAKHEISSKQTKPKGSDGKEPTAKEKGASPTPKNGK